MSSLEEIVERSYLYDFYGELLTEHQKSIYQAFVFEDFTLSEIATDQGISRQCVHDLIKRCDKQLAAYEEKLHLVERFQSLRKYADAIIERCEDQSISDKEKVATSIENAKMLLEDL